MGIFSKDNGYIGVDIGTSSVKIVQLEKKQGKIRLVTYGWSEAKKETEDKNWAKDVSYIVKIIDKLCAEIGITTDKAVASLPAFSVFSSIINLSNVDKKDLAEAVDWEAKKIIPLPLEEMVLDWKLLSEKNDKKNIKIFLTGSPKKLVKKYVSIFRDTQINLASLETETFSLIRSLIGKDKTALMLVEIGANNTNISIVRDGIPVLNRSLDMGGRSITKVISNSLNIGFERAEQFKRDLGMVGSGNGEDVIPKTISASINPIVNEIKYLINLFHGKSEEKIEKIILSGGGATLPNLADFLSKKLDINVIVGNPWTRINYPKELEPILLEIGPGFSSAVGSALRELE